MTKRYPDSYQAVLKALAFNHDEHEVQAVRYALMAHVSLRTPNTLVTFGRSFAKQFVPRPIKVFYTPDGADQFNHATREVRIGKPEMIRVLHEIGHAKYGESEEAAVAYSLGLILKAQPGFVPDLTGHVLGNDPY